MAKPLISIVNGKKVYKIPADRMNKRNSRIFIFGLNQYMEHPPSNNSQDFKLLLLQTLDLHQIAFSQMPDSFFQIIRADFIGDFGLKNPTPNSETLSHKSDGLYIVCFTQSGGCQLVVLRLRNTGRGNVIAANTGNLTSDYELEMVGQIDDYHTRSVLSSQRTDGLLWTMDGNGVFKQLNWDKV